MNTTTPTRTTRTTRIAWTRHTINFWWGCTKVSTACKNCYAAALGAYFGTRLFGQPVKWGQGMPRFERLLQARKEALKLNHRASRCRVLNGIPMIETGSTETVGKPETLRIDFTDARVPLKQRTDHQQLTPLEWETLPAYRPRVFVNSMSDWLDNEVPIAWLAYLLETIYLCPHLDFQLLTKRPENWKERLRLTLGQPGMGDVGITENWLLGTAPANIWIGTTTENQEYADKRIPHLLKIPAKIRFLSCEPLSGPIDLLIDGELCDWSCPACGSRNVDPDNFDADNGKWWECRDCKQHDYGEPAWTPKLHWVIAGGESGASATPSHPAWFRSLRDQCASAGVPFFFKQWGEWIPQDHLEAAMPAARESGTPVTEPRSSYRGQHVPDVGLMLRPGTAIAGNLLDGRKHEAFPQ